MKVAIALYATLQWVEAEQYSQEIQFQWMWSIANIEYLQIAVS